jgi:hypothetical protein
MTVDSVLHGVLRVRLSKNPSNHGLEVALAISAKTLNAS